jgi:hypothetical protein
MRRYGIFGITLRIQILAQPMDSILSRIAKIIYNININFFRFPSDLPSSSFQKLSLNQYISLLQLPPSKLRVHSKLQQPLHLSTVTINLEVDTVL